MDRFDAIRTLLAAVDGGSLSAASRKLGVPLPTVSRQVSELEARLRTQLVIRTNRKLLLTDAGSAFVAAGRRVLEELEEAERAAAGEYRIPRGDLLVTAPIMFGKLHVTPVVLAFLAAYPEVNVRVVLFDHVIDLVENHVDVAVRIGHLPDSGLVAARIGEIHWVICASPAYLSTRGTPVAPDDLAQHDCIGFEGLQMVRTWPFGRGTNAKTVAIRPRFAANTADAIIEAAIAGIGIARLTSYQAAGAIREGRLVSLLRGYGPEPLPVHLVHTGPPLVPLKMRAFLDFASPRLKASLADIAKI
ncbi:MAG TPA: LysR family transcriptional regulator [Pseudolabrys sp.]|nr:LysR family transcriptional regulator [Pseudolabrys sp.]